VSTETPVLRLDADARTAWESAAEALREGGLVVVPTETVYGLAACVARPDAVARLREVKGRPEAPFALAVASLDDVRDELEAPPPCALRIAARWWPGPVTQILPRREGGTLGVRVPGPDALRALIASLPAPLALPSANPAGAPAPSRVEDLAPAIVEAAALVLDGGPTPLGEASTLVEPSRDAIRIRRRGVVSADDLRAHAAPVWLLVCTGNTCRSPMAAALLRHELAARARDRDDLVLPRVESAGLSAAEGAPATPQAVEALGRRGIDLSAHRAHPLTPERLERADRVFGLSQSHLETLRAGAPDLADRVELLDPEGGGVDDPYGAPVETYAAVADRLAGIAAWRVAAALPPQEQAR